MTPAQLLYGSSVYAVPSRTLVALPYAWQQVRPEEQEQLSKLLAYYRVALGHVQIVHREQMTAADFDLVGISRAVLFGVGSDLPFGKVTRIHHVSVVNACALNELRGLEASRKSQLTEAFKSLFLAP